MTIRTTYSVHNDCCTEAHLTVRKCGLTAEVAANRTQPADADWALQLAKAGLG
jgi:hypothetical protein